MARTEKEIVVPEHIVIEYGYECDICGEDASDDLFDLNCCLVCGKSVCGNCSYSVLDRTHGENITVWDLQCDSSHICNDCMKTGNDYIKELYRIDAAHASSVDTIIKKWKEEVLLRESSELPRTGD